MILVHILAKNNEQALEIVEVLTDRKLLLHAMLFEKTVYQKNPATRKLEGLEQVMVMGKTKALLFNTINKLLLKLVSRPYAHALCGAHHLYGR